MYKYQHLQKIIECKIDSLKQIEDFTFELANEIEYNSKNKKSKFNDKVRARYARMANEIIKDLMFNPDDFLSDTEVKNKLNKR